MEPCSVLILVSEDELRLMSGHKQVISTLLTILMPHVCNTGTSA